MSKLTTIGAILMLTLAGGCAWFERDDADPAPPAREEAAAVDGANDTADATVEVALAVDADADTDAAADANADAPESEPEPELSEEAQRVAALPEVDPSVDNPVQLADATRGRHPRLLFTEDDIDDLRDFARNDGARFFEHVAEYARASVPPAADEVEFPTNDTDGQRQGLWRMPTVALHYVITGDETSFENARGFLELMVGLEHWQHGVETDSGMGHGNLLAGVALVYDMLYNDLEPDFRDKVRAKLIEHARRQYYIGHLSIVPGRGYWKNDTHNNHRWHRNVGLVLAAITAAEEDRDDHQWILRQAKDELDYVVSWLPEDGTTHESPSYMVFGGLHLFLTVDAADRNLGTDHLDHPFFANILPFRVYTASPGFEKNFGYGDSTENAFGGYSNYHYKAVAITRDPDYHDAILRMHERHPTAAWLGWPSLLWYDASVERGSVENLPLAYYFPDIGLASVRDGWDADNVAAVFLNYPYGGHKLNQYRNERDFQYINVAHDDPDANSFIIYARGQMIAKTDGYSFNKLTAAQNTILVNGRGQPREGGMWMQPVGNTDMTELTRTTTYKLGDDGTLVYEGEAGPSYEGIDRFRRAMIWVPGRYVLIFDDIRGSEANEIAWLVQSETAAVLGDDRYVLEAEGEAMEFVTAATAELTAEVAESPAQNRHDLLGYEQIRLTAEAEVLNIAAAFDPWEHGELTVTIEPDGEDAALILVTGPGFADVWTWQAAPDLWTPATWTGQRNGEAFIEVGPDDQAELH